MCEVFHISSQNLTLLYSETQLSLVQQIHVNLGPQVGGATTPQLWQYFIIKLWARGARLLRLH